MSKRDAAQVHNERRLTFGLDEIAQSLGVSTPFIRLEVSRGRLHVIRIGRRVLIPAAEVARYLNAAGADSTIKTR